MALDTGRIIVSLRHRSNSSRVRRERAHHWQQLNRILGFTKEEHQDQSRECAEDVRPVIDTWTAGIEEVDRDIDPSNYNVIPIDLAPSNQSGGEHPKNTSRCPKRIGNRIGEIQAC